jgi:methyltransferase (TIGR00027 family)
MKEGKPSRIAEGNAAFRTAESMKAERERICYDPLAKYFLGPKYGLLSKSQLLTRIGLWNAEREVPGAYGYNVARCRYVDDYLKERIEDEIRQLVIMGAGYDTRAYRFTQLKGRVKVFEIDHLDTQRAKREKIKEIFGSLPDHVVYVPVDFNKEKLAEKLPQSGYATNLKTLFIWEGVTMYITAQAVDETLSFVANNSGAGSSIIFDYIYKSLLDGTSELEEAKKVRRAHERRGEPNKFGIEEGSIEAFLKDRGFCQVRNITCADFKNLYFRGANQNCTTYRLFALVHAKVKPSS